MGEVCKDYSDYEKHKLIGSGGFGEVYRYAEKFAIKQEYKVYFYTYVSRITVDLNFTCRDHLLWLIPKCFII